MQVNNNSIVAPIELLQNFGKNLESLVKTLLNSGLYISEKGTSMKQIEDYLKRGMLPLKRSIGNVDLKQYQFMKSKTKSAIATQCNRHAKIICPCQDNPLQVYSKQDKDFLMTIAVKTLPDDHPYLVKKSDQQKNIKIPKTLYNYLRQNIPNPNYRVRRHTVNFSGDQSEQIIQNEQNERENNVELEDGQESEYHSIASNQQFENDNNQQEQNQQPNEESKNDQEDDLELCVYCHGENGEMISCRQCTGKAHQDCINLDMRINHRTHRNGLICPQCRQIFY